MQTWPYDHVVTWSHVTNKNDISKDHRRLQKLTRWRFVVKGHHPLSFSTHWSRNQVITCLMQVYYSSIDTTFDHMVIWGHMKNEKCFKFTFRWPVAIKLDRGWIMIRSQMSIHKATYSFDHVVTLVHVTNECLYFYEAYCY